jgi:hypothetical protein
MLFKILCNDQRMFFLLLTGLTYLGQLLNGKIGKDWIDLTKNLYKTRCKETFINAPLIHW